MQKSELIFDGNEKQIFATDDSTKVIISYNDVTLAFNSIKRAVFKGKGVLDNHISAALMGELNRNGVKTHFIEEVGDNEQLCYKVELIPLILCVRNRIAGSLSTLLGVEEGMKPVNTIYDLRLNNTRKADPLINDHHAVALGIVSYQELQGMYAVAEKVNGILKPFLAKAGIELVDIKLEFGRKVDTGEIIISDEISPDTCRFWDIKTGNILDKDRFRKDLSDVVASYKEVYDRVSKIREA